MRLSLGKFTAWALGALLIMFLTIVPASADSTLHIGAGAGTACAMGCADDPNTIGNGNAIDIFQTSGSSKDILGQPQLLILGIPNDTTNLFASDPITGVTYINPYPAGTSISGSSSSFSFKGDMTAGEEVYGFLGLSGNNSNSFTNWAAADASINKITASNFGIYELSLSGGDLGPKGLINVLFNSGALPLGTFVVAYGTNSEGKPFDTPFTEAGLTTSSTTPSTVPEPSTLLLLGTGLIGLSRFKRGRTAAS